MANQLTVVEVVLVVVLVVVVDVVVEGGTVVVVFVNVGVVRGVVVDELVVIPSELSELVIPSEFIMHSLSSRCQNLSQNCE